jgi:hypothetical protein
LASLREATPNEPLFRQEPIMDLKSVIIILLAIAVGVLGYLYYESQQSTVRVDLPGVKIEAK